MITREKAKIMLKQINKQLSQKLKHKEGYIKNKGEKCYTMEWKFKTWMIHKMVKGRE
jgi:hypothetical protein